MGRAARPTVLIELTDEERETLVRSSRRHSSSQALALRSRIVLACADGRPNTKIADGLGCDRAARDISNSADEFCTRRVRPDRLPGPAELTTSRRQPAGRTRGR